MSTAVVALLQDRILACEYCSVVALSDMLSPPPIFQLQEKLQANPRTEQCSALEGKNRIHGKPIRAWMRRTRGKHLENRSNGR